MASANAEARWREFFADPANYTPQTVKDAEAKMFANTPLARATGNPLRDPLWLPVEVSERRRAVMTQMQIYEESVTPCGFNNHVIEDGNRVYSAGEYKIHQHRTAYEMLRAGVDVRTIAATIHRPVDWVEDIAQQFHLK
jgi:hypothetical protein